MFAILSQKKNGKGCFYRYFRHSGKKTSKEIPTEKQPESFRKYRDSAVWHLLRLENSIDVNDLPAYWKLMDTMMDLSLKSAITHLQKHYGYRVRKLHPNGKKKGSSKKLYRLEDNKRSGYRDVCANTLLKKTVDLLQSEVKHLIRTK